MYEIDNNTKNTQIVYKMFSPIQLRSVMLCDQMNKRPKWQMKHHDEPLKKNVVEWLEHI